MRGVASHSWHSFTYFDIWFPQIYGRVQRIEDGQDLRGVCASLKLYQAKGRTTPTFKSHKLRQEFFVTWWISQLLQRIAGPDVTIRKSVQIFHPATNLQDVSITPPTGAILPLSTAQRQELLITSVLDHCENYVCQPCPYPLDAEQTVSSLLAYEFYNINPRAYPCLEQGEEIQLRLEGDIQLTAAQCDPFNLSTCDSLLQGLATLQALAEGMLDSKLQLLKALQQMTTTMFLQHTQDGQQGASPVPLSAETRESFKSFDVDIGEWASPAQAYAIISVKWGELERSITEEALLVLSLRLQALRLGFYRSAGQYLSDQAQTLLSHHLGDEEWVGPGEVHRGGALLKSCVEDPFLSRWPNADGLRRPNATRGMNHHGK